MFKGFGSVFILFDLRHVEYYFLMILIISCVVHVWENLIHTHPKANALAISSAFLLVFLRLRIVRKSLSDICVQVIC